METSQNIDQTQHIDATDFESLRTLFVSGFPYDLKRREVHNLFRGFTGYEGNMIKRIGGEGSERLVAFVSFMSHEQAVQARDALQGFQFDPDAPGTLRLEFAKSNTRISKRPSDSCTPEDKRMRWDYQDPRHQQSMSYPPQYPYGQGGYSYPTPYSGGMWDSRFAAPQTAYPAQRMGGAPPCNTLFVANLETTITEESLREIFSKYPGFKRLRLTPKGTNSMGFFEFMTREAATQAMAGLQGTSIPGSQGPLRVEFARNPMGTPSRRFDYERTVPQPAAPTENYAEAAQQGE
eukprot:gnl/Trimastix_PCT/900.p1 GENE.gnl/Trimastix_PCT/900~~gnl/Trimastix_PCT/900.p1  ORF type:complete len:305 (+),score=66.05 gnl/Trimastix_PCT/900:42-917(+)